MIHVLGVDPSLTHTGVVYGAMPPTDTDPTEVKHYAIKTDLKKHAHPIARLAHLAAYFDMLLDEVEEQIGGPSILTVENYSFGSKNSRPHSLGEWGGQVRLNAYWRGWTVVVVSPSVLKKLVTGKGNAEKDLMMMEILSKWGYKPLDNNNADAYALMRLGLIYARHRMGETVLKKELELLKTVEVFEPRQVRAASS